MTLAERLLLLDRPCSLPFLLTAFFALRFTAFFFVEIISLILA